MGLSISDSELFASGNRSAEELLRMKGCVDEPVGPRGEAAILAPWLAFPLVAANDTGSLAAGVIGALRDTISIEKNADGLRIMTLKLWPGRDPPRFTLKDCFVHKKGSAARGYEIRSHATEVVRRMMIRCLFNAIRDPRVWVITATTRNWLIVADY